MVLPLIGRALRGDSPLQGLSPSSIRQSAGQFVEGRIQDVAMIPVRGLVSDPTISFGLNTVRGITRMFDRDDDNATGEPRRPRAQEEQNQANAPAYFLQYQTRLFTRIDSIIDLLKKSQLFSTPPTQATPAGELVAAKPEEKEKDKRTNWLATFLAGLSGVLAGIDFRLLIAPLLLVIRSLVSWISSIGRAIVNAFRGLVRAISAMAQLAMRIIRGIGPLFSRLATLARDVGRAIRTQVTRTIADIGKFVTKNIIEPVSSFVRSIIERTRNLVSSVMGRIREFARRLGSRAASVFRGLRIPGMFQRLGTAGRSVLRNLGRLSGFFRGLGSSLRGVPVVGTVIGLLFENMERDEKLQRLNEQLESGEITQEEFRQKSTEAVVQMAMNVFGTGAGAALGMLLGPVGAAVGAVGGRWIANQFGGPLAGIIARAMNETSDNMTPHINQAKEYFQETLPNMIADLPNRFPQLRDAFQQSHETLQRNFGSAWNVVQQTGRNIFNAASSIFTGQPAPPPMPAATPVPSTRQSAPVATPIMPPPANITEEPVATGGQSTLVVVNNSTNVSVANLRQNRPPTGRVIPGNTGAYHG